MQRLLSAKEECSASVTCVLKLQVNQLEDELEDAKTSAAKQPQPQQQQGDAELAGLREENATLQRRLVGLQAQVGPY